MNAPSTTGAPTYAAARALCHAGMFVQALVINFTPMLFIPLREQFGLSFEQIGRLVLLNFLAQMLVDLVMTGLADRVPARPLIAGANFLAAAGLWIFAAAPICLGAHYAALVVGTLVFSVGCGLFEVLLSPMINAIPSHRKSSDMALLHAFYPIGKVSVILATGAALFFFGQSAWPWVAVGWSLVPLAGFVGFLLASIPAFVADSSRRTTLRSLLRGRGFWIMLGLMMLGGAAEVSLAQWASAFVQKGLGFSKVIADVAGFGMFGIGMVVGRLWFGLRARKNDGPSAAPCASQTPAASRDEPGDLSGAGESQNLRVVLATGAALTFLACIGMAFIPSPTLALLVCAASGLFVSMLWPGTISMAASTYPLAGASMFAFLAAAGDMGGALMPWAAGWVADSAIADPQGWIVTAFGGDAEAAGLRAAMTFTALAPLGFFLLCLTTHAKKPVGCGRGIGRG